VYDESRWSKDSVYLYIITDGSVGGPREPRVVKSEATLSSCDVCEPKPGTSDAHMHERQAALAHLSGLLSSERASTASGPVPSSGQLELRRFLQGLGLGHLEQVEALRDAALRDVAAEAVAGRTAFLASLKAKGVDKLAERQKLANGVARALREGTIPNPPPPKREGSIPLPPPPTPPPTTI